MTKNLSDYQSKIETSLFLLRIGVFIVMLVWTIDKFINPSHSAAVMEAFYFIDGAGATMVMIIGAIELLIILAFIAGMWKKYTYGFVMTLHAVSTFSTYKPYMEMNLLFFAAWPMLAACIALYLLRDLDVKFTFGKK